MAKQFAVLHLQKGTGSGGGLGSHIDRSRKVLNADPELTIHNKHIVLQDGKPFIVTQKQFEKMELGKLQDLVKNRVEEGRTNGPRDKKGELKEIRKDAVRYVNVVMTGSHTQMSNLVKEGKLDEWTKENYRWAAKEFGTKNIVRFAVHMDERTPHIHCTVVPLTDDGRLSAKEVMGDRRKMSDRQTRYAEEMVKFGLSRGIKGSTARHEEVSEYYARIKQPVEAEISLPKKDLFESGDKYRAKVIKSLEGFILSSKGQAETIKDLTHEILSKNSLLQRSADTNKLLKKSLDQAEEEKNKIRETLNKRDFLLEGIAQGKITPHQIKELFEEKQKEQQQQQKKGRGIGR